MLWFCINVTKKLNSDLIIAANNVIKTDSINLINIFMSQNVACHFAMPAASVAFSLFAASSFDTIQKSAYSAITAQRGNRTGFTGVTGKCAHSII